MMNFPVTVVIVYLWVCNNLPRNRKRYYPKHNFVYGISGCYTDNKKQTKTLL